MRKGSGVAEGSDSSTMMKNFSVLVVEDDSYLRNLYRRLLNVFGFLNDFQMKVEMAANGKEAVDVLRGGVSLNLIIMDMDRCTNALEVCLFTLKLRRHFTHLKQLKTSFICFCVCEMQVVKFYSSEAISIIFTCFCFLIETGNKGTASFGCGEQHYWLHLEYC